MAKTFNSTINSRPQDNLFIQQGRQQQCNV